MCTRARAPRGCQVEAVGFFSLFAGTWLPFTGTCSGISRQQWGSFSDCWQLLRFCRKPPWEPPSSFALFLRCALCVRVLSRWAVFLGPAFPFKGMRLSGRHPSLWDSECVAFLGITRTSSNDLRQQDSYPWMKTLGLRENTSRIAQPQPGMLLDFL